MEYKPARVRQVIRYAYVRFFQNYIDLYILYMYGSIRPPVTNLPAAGKLLTPAL